VSTLVGLDDNPAELVGYGPIPAKVGRALAADAQWRRVLTDPRTGTVLDLGHRRVPTPALARLVRHQQARCLFPGCGMPATRTDIDHTVAYTDGGCTALDNLGLLCRHHHLAKHP
jgi:5-methylcytosine-specific restriction endonuclease McrA